MDTKKARDIFHVVNDIKKLSSKKLLQYYTMCFIQLRWREAEVKLAETKNGECFKCKSRLVARWCRALQEMWSMDSASQNEMFLSFNALLYGPSVFAHHNTRMLGTSTSHRDGKPRHILLYLLSLRRDSSQLWEREFLGFNTGK